MKKAGLDAKILQAERRDLATLAVLSGDAIGSITDPTEAAIAFACRLAGHFRLGGECSALLGWRLFRQL
jgi:hypothetical protein